ncbi:hypothetical protein KIPE111705_46130 [Kibdelosporangium persicum]|uniref:PknH-like extracellular domain-containing protein n=1 Tax=Kibdelosporangium persicum TaxID=2698649 RepID=A0ABX2FJ06_9PSEU|nr:hypothetical protein [Kibdelosporangium persicum]NRN71411.1 hypothetical protein [Kibdelosporangium persicum]
MHVLAGVGAALLLAGCSDRPNDLRDNRYYQDPEPAPVSTSSPASTPQQPPRPAAAPTARPKALELDKFALTAADLAGEGVQPSGSPARTVQATLPDCQAPLGDAAAAYQTAWSYPTGSTIRQYLAEYEGNAEEIVTSARAKLTCGRYQAGGAEVRVSAPAVADKQVSWCATSTRQSACTVLTAHGRVLSVVVVTAATEAKAKPAVTRIAPLAATALARNS